MKRQTYFTITTTKRNILISPAEQKLSKGNNFYFSFHKRSLTNEKIAQVSIEKTNKETNKNETHREANTKELLQI